MPKREQPQLSGRLRLIDRGTAQACKGTYSDAGTARARFHSAAGSANETRSALAVAAAWGYIDRDRADAVDDRIDEVLKMLWALASPKK